MSTLKAVPAWPARPSSARPARRCAARSGGPEGKLRGRPPPPVEPRSGPWRRTGSESGAGRAQTRHVLSMTKDSAGPQHARKLASRDLLQPSQPPVCRGLCCRGSTFERKLTQREGWVPLTQLCDFLKARRQLRERPAPAQTVHRTELLVRCSARPHEICVVGVRKAIGA